MNKQLDVPLSQNENFDFQKEYHSPSQTISSFISSYNRIGSSMEISIAQAISFLSKNLYFSQEVSM